MRSSKISEHLQKILIRLSKKDKLLYDRVIAKMAEIINCEDVDHYKNLKYNMKDSKRTHVGHFVLIFRHDKENDEISFEDFDHYSNVY